MTFWIIIGTMVLLVVLILSRAAFGTARTTAPAANPDLQIYRDQLAEVERDVSRGVLSVTDATRVRTEVSRRILAADAAAADATMTDPATGATRWVVAVLALVLVGGSIGIYKWLGAPGYGDLALADRIAMAEELRKTRPDQASAEAGLPAYTDPEGMSAEYVTLLTQLRETVKTRPDDLQGHQLLAQNEANVGNYSGAARALETVLRLKGAEATAQDLTDYGELLVLAAGGYVSPEAETALRASLAKDEDMGAARYYLGLMMVQTGRPDIGFRQWDALLRRGPPEAPWINPILAQIAPVAEMAGIRYEIPDIGRGIQTGPSASDIDAAAEMSPAERMEMIGSMVSGLSDRLAREGGPPEDWARLISSLGVLGQTGQAMAVYENAREVFADNPLALDLLYRAGDRAGVAE